MAEPSNCSPVTVGMVVPTAASLPEPPGGSAAPSVSTLPALRSPLGTTVPPLGDACPPVDELLERETPMATMPATRTTAARAIHSTRLRP